MAESGESSQTVVAKTSIKRSVKSIAKPIVKPRAGKPGRFTNSLELFGIFIKSIRRTKCYEFFFKPVERVGYAIPNYYGIVKEAMDIDTLKKRVKNQYYYSIVEALGDFQQLLRNCFMYNNESHDCYKCGLQLKRAFQENLLLYPEEEEEIVSVANRLRKRKLQTATMIEEPPHIAECKKLLLRLSSLCPQSLDHFARPLEMKTIYTGESYDDIIREPIDLLTISHKLKYLLYKDLDECVYDIRLIYLNGLKIYGTIDFIYKDVQFLRETFENLFQFYQTHGDLPNIIDMPLMNTPRNEDPPETTSSTMEQDELHASLEVSAGTTSFNEEAEKLHASLKVASETTSFNEETNELPASLGVASENTSFNEEAEELHASPEVASETTSFNEETNELPVSLGVASENTSFNEEAEELHASPEVASETTSFNEEANELPASLGVASENTSFNEEAEELHASPEVASETTSFNEETDEMHASPEVASETTSFNEETNELPASPEAASETTSFNEEEEELPASPEEPSETTSSNEETDELHASPEEASETTSCNEEIDELHVLLEGASETYIFREGTVELRAPLEVPKIESMEKLKPMEQSTDEVEQVNDTSERFEKIPKLEMKKKPRKHFIFNSVLDEDLDVSDTDEETDDDN